MRRWTSVFQRPAYLGRPAFTINSIAHKKFRPTLALCGGVVLTRFERLRRSAAVCALALVVELPRAHAGEPASPWDGDARTAMRLIAGSSAAPTAAAGVENRAQPRWANDRG